MSTPRTMPGAAARGLEAANRALSWAGAIGIILMMLHIVANAALRAFASAPLNGTNELIAFWYMPAVALFGFIVAQRDRGHTEARVLFDRLPRRNRIELYLAGLAITAALCAGFAYFGLLEALHSQEIGLTGGVTGVTIWPVTFLVPLTYAVLVVQVLTEIILVLRAPGRVDADEGQADARL